VVGAAGLEDAVGLAGLEVVDDAVSGGLIERVGGPVGREGPGVQGAEREEGDRERSKFPGRLDDVRDPGSSG
jgi:hypothetical protein